MLPRILMQEIYANNLANGSTAGYKKDDVFLQQFAEAQKQPGIITDLDWDTPMVDEVYIDFEQGQLQKTEQTLDVGIKGDGFFVVNTPEGDRYTRGGEFNLTADGTLVDSSGYKVMGDTGPITITGDDIAINGEGTIYADGSELAKLRVVDFQHPYNLRKADEGYFVPENAQDLPITALNYEIKQGFIEASNVNTIDTMVDMLASFRAYEAGQKAIQTQDETLDKAVNDVGRV